MFIIAGISNQYLPQGISQLHFDRNLTKKIYVSSLIPIVEEFIFLQPKSIGSHVIAHDFQLFEASFHTLYIASIEEQLPNPLSF